MLVYPLGPWKDIQSLVANTNEEQAQHNATSENLKRRILKKYRNEFE